MMEFPVNPADYPRYIFLDTQSNPMALYKPFQYIPNLSGEVYIDLIGMVLGSEVETKVSIPIIDFLSGRFVPVLNVSQLRQLVGSFQALDSNVLFGGSFPNIPQIVEPITDSNIEENPPIIEA